MTAQSISPSTPGGIRNSRSPSSSPVGPDTPERSGTQFSHSLRSPPEARSGRKPRQISVVPGDTDSEGEDLHEQLFSFLPKRSCPNAQKTVLQGPSTKKKRIVEVIENSDEDNTQERLDNLQLTTEADASLNSKYEQADLKYRGLACQRASTGPAVAEKIPYCTYEAKRDLPEVIDLCSQEFNLEPNYSDSKSTFGADTSEDSNLWLRPAESDYGELDTQERDVAFALVDVAEENYASNPQDAAEAASSALTLHNNPNAASYDRLDLSDEQQRVLDIALQGENLLITEAAGSGKTVVIKAIQQYMDNTRRPYRVIAPTALAALPLAAKTLHSLLGWDRRCMTKSCAELIGQTTSFVEGLLRYIDVLIIDEVSMISNFLLERMERMDRMLRHARADDPPFGGVQVIFVGDFHQLPPTEPFSNCLDCGGPMSHSISKVTSKSRSYTCMADNCSRKEYAELDQ